MVADDIVPIPLEMWNWGISNLSGALRSFPEETVKLALMPADKATITARGIKFKGLYYLCERAVTEHWFETARAKGSWKVNISYDSRNMSKIYVRQSDGSVDICWLATWQDKYEGKCLHEVNYLHEVEKLLRRKNAPKEMTSKAELTAAIEDVIAEAEEMARQTVVPESKTERTKNIRENRHKEKEANRQSEAFSLAEEEAKYLPQKEVPDYIGNPLIEALPPIYLPHEVIKRLTVDPKHNEAERELEADYRFHCMGRLFRYFQPLDVHLEIEKRISKAIRQGSFALSPSNSAYPIQQRTIILDTACVGKTGLPF